MANKKQNFNEGIFEGVVKDLRSFNHTDGKGLLFNLEHHYSRVGKTGETEEKVKLLKCCVHPSMVDYLGKRISEGQELMVTYRLQVKSVKQPDGSYKNPYFAMVTGIMPHANKIEIIGYTANDGWINESGTVASITVSSNDRFGDGTSYIKCKFFANSSKRLIEWYKKGYLKKGTGVCISGEADTDDKGELSLVIDQLYFVNNKKELTQVPQGYTPVPEPEVQPQQQEEVYDIADSGLPF